MSITDPYDFLRAACATANDPFQILKELVWHHVEYERGAHLAHLLSGPYGYGRDLSDLPPRGQSYWFGFEQRLARLRKELEDVLAWTPQEATAKAKERHRIHVEHDAERRAEITAQLGVADQLIARVASWHPISDDSAVQVKLEIFRANLLTELVKIRRWAQDRFSDLSPRTKRLSGPAFKRAEVAQLQAEITKEEATVASVYGGIDAERDYLEALVPQLAALFKSD